MLNAMMKKFTRFVLVPLIAILLFSASAWAVQPGMVNTVLGPIPAEKLGQTLAHEHFVLGYPGYHADETIAPVDRESIINTNLKDIKAAQNAGIGTIIDATPSDGARFPEVWTALSQKTGLNIICSTGLYTQHEGAPAYWIVQATLFGQDISKNMSELFIAEITKGIGKSGVKAGVIKVATAPIMTDYEKAVHKAAVMAQKETGVPIYTHTQAATGGIEQADLLLSLGANPKKIVIGHISNSRDIEYHKAILAKGVYIGFDRIGLDFINPFDIIVKNVSELCKLGYAKQIMLSHDHIGYFLGRQLPLSEMLAKATANWRLDMVSTKFLPALKAQGVTDEQIKMMMVDNPKNLFLGK
jgi:phosphotriesterase-related protein